MASEFDDIGSVKALLTDARERIKESETRSLEKITECERRLSNADCDLDKRLMKYITEMEKRVTESIYEIDSKFDSFNNRFLEWIPLLTNLKSTEEVKRNMNLLLIVSFITTIASWILTIFIFFIKKGGA